MWAALIAIAEGLVALVEILSIIGLLAGAVYVLFTDAGRKNAAKLIASFMRGLFDIAGELARELPDTLQPIVQDFKNSYTSHKSSILDTIKEPFREAATAAFNQVVNPLLGGGVKAPEDWVKAASEAMADAFELGLGSFAITAIFEAIFPKDLNVLNGTGPMLASLAGFAEVSRASLRPTLDAAVTAPATYDANNKVRPHLPDLARALELHARRVIGDGELDTLIGYNGLNPRWAAEVTAASYRPIQPRALAQAIGAHNFDRDQLVDVMRYAGHRDADIGVFIEAMVERGLEPLRKGVIDQTIKLAGDGLLSDSDVASSLDAQNLTDAAKNLINQHIALLRLHTMATLTRVEAINAAKNELITLDQLAADLSGVGYQDAEVQIMRNSVAQYLTAKAARLEARELSAEEARVQQITIREAQESYKRGEIDGATFAAELVAAGIPADRIAALAGLAAVLSEPTLKPGVKLSAYALKQQSAKLATKALEEEFRKSTIDEATLRAGLLANGMSQNDVDATVNYLVALSTKATAAAASPAAAASTNGAAPA